MSCKKWNTDVALFAGGDLPERRLARVLSHLESCADCRELAEDLRAGRALFRESGDEAIGDEMAMQVRRAVLARLPAENARATPRYWAWALASGMVLAVILALPSLSPKQTLVERRQPTPVRVAETPLPASPVRHAAVRRHHRAPTRRAAPQSGEPLLVQLVTDDPNIVIYWLVEPKPQGD